MKARSATLPAMMSMTLRMSAVRLTLLILGNMLFLTLTPAHTPIIPIKGTAHLFTQTGSARGMSGYIELHNRTDRTVAVEIPSVESRLGYSVSVTPDSVRLAGGERLRLSLTADIMADGKYRVAIPIEVKNAENRRIGTIEAELYLRVTGGLYALENYESLFLNPAAIDKDDEGLSVNHYRVGPPPRDFPLSRDFEVERTPVETLEMLRRETVFETDWSGQEVSSPTLPLPPPRGAGVASPTLPLPPPASRGVNSSDANQMAEKLDRGSVYAELNAALQAKGLAPVATAASDMTAKGTLMFTGVDGLLHPCYGWRVYAFADVFGSKIKLVKGNVKSNGNWELTVPYLPGFKVYIEYQPRNVYFTLKNLNGAYYSFSSGAKYTPAPDKVINEYTQAAYLANDSLVGLGEIHRDAMFLWDKLATKGNGISPLRASSISIYYPNTNYDCGNGDGDPWSCADTDGKIWLIPAHATGRFVVMHELGHQLNYEYWDNQIPSGAGGPHTLDDCFTTSLALLEGFADFLPMWARFNQTTIPSGTGTFDIETPSACATTNKNETWVAACFWDLYDKLDDGDDTIYFTKTGATVGKYLKSGTKSSMSSYRSIYKGIASPQHQWIVDAIFDQNNQ